MTTRKFSELRAKMSPERRARVEARTKEILAVDEAARKLCVKILQIWNDEEMSPKETNEQLLAVVTKALTEARG